MCALAAVWVWDDVTTAGCGAGVAGALLDDVLANTALVRAAVAR
jgi:hypothetical protein